jgi:hypothetical protein
MDAYISANDLIKDLCLMNEDFSLSKAAIYASHLKTELMLRKKQKYLSLRLIKIQIQ